MIWGSPVIFTLLNKWNIATNHTVQLMVIGLSGPIGLHVQSLVEMERNQEVDHVKAGDMEEELVVDQVLIENIAQVHFVQVSRNVKVHIVVPINYLHSKAINNLLFIIFSFLLN